MERKITCREIIMFIAKFELWAAKFGSNLAGITFITYDESGEVNGIYIICSDGNYAIKVWDETMGEEGDWKVIEEGNVFNWKEIGSK